ncbi:MAG: nuclear transport factor 2 family protein [Jatrophihabitans sp.]|nr:MAG: nuclear transport factor 2 family protein [Jatrophihabitans sp.]
MTSLDDRVAALEHVQAITALKYRYWRACDAKDPDAMRECFVRRGARIEYGPMGSYDDVAGLIDIFTRIALRRLDDGRWAVLDMHHGLHPQITVRPDGTATGRWTLQFRQVDNERGTERLSAGEYEDEYAREDGQWRIAATTYRVRWGIERPLADAAVTQ